MRDSVTLTQRLQPEKQMSCPKTPEYLTLRQAADAYPGLLNCSSMRCWIARGSYGFDRLVTRAGRSVRIRRDRLDRFVGERRHA